MTFLLPLCIGIVIGVLARPWLDAWAFHRRTKLITRRFRRMPPPVVDQATILRERVSLEAIERGFKRSAS